MKLSRAQVDAALARLCVAAAHGSASDGDGPLLVEVWPSGLWQIVPLGFDGSAGPISGQLTEEFFE
jgi:hypothetical protein